MPVKRFKDWKYNVCETDEILWNIMTSKMTDLFATNSNIEAFHIHSRVFFTAMLTDFDLSTQRLPWGNVARPHVQPFDEGLKVRRSHLFLRLFDYELLYQFLSPLATKKHIYKKQQVKKNTWKTRTKKKHRKKIGASKVLHHQFQGSGISI